MFNKGELVVIKKPFAPKFSCGTVIEGPMEFEGYDIYKVKFSPYNTGTFYEDQLELYCSDRKTIPSWIYV